jgi:hypothetical protein
MPGTSLREGLPGIRPGGRNGPRSPCTTARDGSAHQAAATHGRPYTDHMRRSRDETTTRDLPGSLWHALSQLQHTHPDPVGRIGPLARPVGLLSFAAAADIVLAARVQLTGAETMHDLHETLRTLTHGPSWDTDVTGPGIALDVTLGKRQELPRHAAHTAGLTHLFQNAAGTIGARRTPGGGRCFHCDGTGLARPLWEPVTGHA